MKFSFNKILFQPSFLNFALFIFILLTLSIPLGLVVLIGPIHKLSFLIQQYQANEFLEDTIIKIVLVLFTLCMIVIAIWLVKLREQTSSRLAKWFFILFPLLAGFGGGWLFLHPYYFESVETNITPFNAKVAFGGYPTLELLKQLKREGYDGVISTLDPNSIPFEKTLLEKEKELTKEVGLKLLHFPLLPWLGGSTNQKSIELIVDTVKNTPYRYYIHCYLGRDRNGLVTRALQKALPESKFISFSKPRNLKYTRHVEHGAVIHLDNQVYLAPKMLPDELMGYIVSSHVNYVAILNPDIDDIETQQAEQIFQSYFVPHEHLNLPKIPYEPFKYLQVADYIKKLPRPLVIYVPNTASFRSQALIQAYRNHLPPLAPLLFTIPLNNGRVGFLSSNVAIGPRPEPNEFKDYLYAKGIRRCLYLGSPGTPLAEEDRKAAQEAGLDWTAVLTQSLKELRSLTGGPWYLYGPNLNLNCLALVDSFKQGPVRRLTNQIYVIPPPTEQELALYFSQDDIKHVWIVFTTSNPDSLDEAQQQKAKFEALGLSVELIMLSETYHPNELLELAKKAWLSSQPTVIQIKNTEDFLAQAFTEAFFTNVPPLPTSWFNDSKMAVQVAPNIIVGAKPTDTEMIQLKKKGIKYFLEIEETNSLEKRADELYTSDPLITCSNDYTQSECVYQTLSTDGPWYVYGAELKEIEKKLANRFWPPLPPFPLIYPFEHQVLTSPTQMLYCDQCVYSLLPTIGVILLLSPILILYTLLITSFVGYLHTQEVKHYYTRKIFHLSTFSVAAILQVFFNLPAVLLFSLITVIAIIYALIENHRLAFYEALIRPSDSRDQSLGVFFRTVSTALGAVIAYLLFGNFYLVGLLVCGWGDAAAEVVGRHSRRPYKIPSLIESGSKKTIDGSLAMFLVSVLACLIALYLLGSASFFVILLISLIVALIATLAEALSSSKIDNLTIQVFATATAYVLVKWIH